MNEITEIKKKTRGTGIALSLLSLGLAASLSMNAYTLSKVNGFLKAQEEEGLTKEDDVVIAGGYTIRSTKQISDAYLSGKTDSLSSQDKETLQMASDILKEIITDGMTDFDKEKAVYDWMCKNLSTDSGSMTVIPTAGEGVDYPYGVLKNKKAVCVGYATTFRLFMQMLGIDCMVEHNTDNYHSWNLVKLDDHWYITDVYSDSDSGNYSHFNMNDRMLMENGQTWDTSYFPAADSLEYNLVYRNAEKDPDLYSLPAAVRKNLDEESYLYSALFSSNLSETDKAIAEKLLDNIESLLWSTEEYSNVSMYYSWNDLEDGSKLLSISMSRYEEEPSEEIVLTDEQLEKIDTAVNDSFGDVTYKEDYGDDIIWDSDGNDGSEVGDLVE